MFALHLDSSNPHKVLQHLGASFLLKQQGELDGAVEKSSDDFYILLTHIARCQGGRSQANATWHLRGCVARYSIFWINKILDNTIFTWDRIQTVDRDPHQVTKLFNLAAGQAERSQIPKNKVVISASSLKFVTVLDQAGSECPGIGNNLFCVGTKRRLGNLQKGSCNTGNCLKQFR